MSFCRLSQWLWNGQTRKLHFSRHGDSVHIELQTVDMHFPPVRALRRSAACGTTCAVEGIFAEQEIRPTPEIHYHQNKIIWLQTRKLERLQIGVMECHVALPWRPPPRDGAARVVLLASGAHVALRYDCAASTSST